MLLNVKWDEVVIFPNPLAGNELRLYTGAQAVSVVRISDVTGRAIYETAYNEVMDISAIPAGFYFVQLLDAGGAQLAVAKLERL